MSESSNTPTQPARNLAQLLLQRIAAIKNQAVSSAIKKDESTISRIVSGETGIKLDDLQAFLLVLGYKVVEKNMYCVPRDVHLAYKTLAQEHFNKLDQDWDEPT